jgi:hypothetical protein
MRFGGTPKYAPLATSLLLRAPDDASRVRPSWLCEPHPLESGPSELRSYLDFVRRKVRLGQVRGDGIVLAWDEHVNSRGAKTGEPADDLILR